MNKINFNFKKGLTYRAIRLMRWPVFRFIKQLKRLFLILFILSFFIFLYGFLTDRLIRDIQSLTLGLSIILLVIFLSFKLKELFFNSKIKNPKLTATLTEVISDLANFNIADFLSFEVAQVISKSFIFSNKRKLSEINSELLFYFLISQEKKFNFLFSRVLLDLKEIESSLKDYFETINSLNKPFTLIYSQDFEETLLESLTIAQKKGHSRIEVNDLFIALSKHSSFLNNILLKHNLKTKDIENLIYWLEKLEERMKEEKKFWSKKNLAKKRPLGKHWATGYTLTLDQYSIDLSEKMRKEGFYNIVGHEKEIVATERTLSRSKINNVLLIGEPGSGRRSIVEAIARKSALGESLPEVNYKKVIRLDLVSLLSQTTDLEEVEVILDNIFSEVVNAGNVILFIDDFHNFVNTDNRLGMIDISGILTPYLSYAAFQIIVVTTFEDFHKNIEQNSSILSLFEKIEVSEIIEEETLILLEETALRLELKYKKFVSYQALRDIITYCSKYLPAAPFPEKAIDLLDEAVTHLKQTKDKVLLPEHIAQLVTEKVQIPVGEIEGEEKQVLLNLENLIHQRVINQEKAVDEVSAALRRARSEVSIRKGPMGAFLFLGPTGVGKTETAKALAEVYFGAEERMIRLDMSEFQNVSDIARLLGGPGEEGLLTTKIKQKPFSLVLLDEIEKAHPNILNLFLQVLDEGHLTDGLGRKINFRNSIIIATSNAGYQIILQALSEKTEWLKVKDLLLDHLFKENIFRPEFINRFDALVVFSPLSRENLLSIADLMLNKLKKNLKKKEIDFIISEDLKKKIVELSYNPVFGAREMTRVIQDKIENVLAVALLSDKIKRGGRVEVNPENFKLKIS